MSLFIESLKRLYKDNKVSKEKINQLKTKGTISENERIYILEEGENNVHNIN